jgi:hypothetical protein
MPNWSTQLPPAQKHQGFDLRRTPTSSSLQAICTCENLLVCDTHFWHGRTTPCERITNEKGKTVDDSTCPACLQKQAWRTHVYVSAFDPRTHQHFIFECTDIAAKPFAEYIDGNGTLRGCSFYANRPKATPNGKVIILTNTVNQARTPLPTAPDVKHALAVIWRLPAKSLEECPTEPKATIIRPNPQILKEMKTQPDNAGRRQQLLDQLTKDNGSKRTKSPA